VLACRTAVQQAAATALLIYRGIQGHRRVVLSGDGSDEIFSGYQQSQGMSYRIPEVNCAATNGRHFPWAQHGAAGADLLSREIKRECSPEERLRQFLAEALDEASELEPVNQEVYLYMKYFLPDVVDIVDRTSFAAGIETQLPFLDKQFLEFSVPMPARYKFHDDTTKHLLKSLVAPLLPIDIVRRRKSHLPIPRDPAAVRQQFALAGQLLLGPAARTAHYFDRDQIRDMLAGEGSFARLGMVRTWQLTLYLITCELHHRAFRL
jgi:asparagine synthase (glutamine-hydrolysing)